MGQSSWDIRYKRYQDLCAAESLMRREEMATDFLNDARREIEGRTEDFCRELQAFYLRRWRCSFAVGIGKEWI